MSPLLSRLTPSSLYAKQEGREEREPYGTLVSDQENLTANNQANIPRYENVYIDKFSDRPPENLTKILYGV
jgi:hypothetical protein